MLLKKIGIKRNVTIAVNGDHDLELNQILKDGDKIYVFSSITGG